MPPFPLLSIQGALHPDTTLQTPHGPRPLHSLATGDLVATPSGPAALLGLHRRPAPQGFAVLLAPDALAPGIPSLPLVVAPETLLRLPGEAGLVPAAALLNSTSISRTPPPPAWIGLTLPAPALLLAHDTPIALTAEAPIEPPGPRLNSLRSRIAARATTAALPMPPSPLTPPPLPPPALPLVLRSRHGPLPTHQPAPLTLSCLIPPHSGPIRLHSPIRYAAGATTPLGICLIALSLDDTPIPLDHPLLGPGFHPPETNASLAWRWTDGTAWLALPYRDTPQKLCLTVTDWHLGLHA